MLLAAALVGCSGGGGDGKPPQPTVTVTKSPSLSAEEARAACVDAWAATIGARPDDFNAETDSDPEPDACKGLPEDEWTDRYMEGLMKSNQENLDEMKDCLDDPTCTRFPVDGS
ncbi:hypothetical protein GLX30_30510 [Streptomyces sp. Tu 2975]|uniref:hypothetical protein n=1 Tax=Streptomyces sp. Tu 2975 TaxID=2676871 RepID=UPI001359DBBA|nr:hypothetical protein [Streptomyces sp. Tu 2975]QIP87646.1 hypothetical protein GLX30_30510 [Streptomyces sp. Tu 2975]